MGGACAGIGWVLGSSFVVFAIGLVEVFGSEESLEGAVSAGASAVFGSAGAAWAELVCADESVV